MSLPPSKRRRRRCVPGIAKCCLTPRVWRLYEQLYPLYRELYFGMGQPDAPAQAFGHVLPRLREIAAQVRQQG